MKKNPLGRGLESLIPKAPEAARKDDTPRQTAGVAEVDIASIVPNDNQPRTVFEQDALSELVESIRQKGIIQPIIVTPKNGGGYMIIAGERRWRAAGLAGLKRVPVVVKEVHSERERLELAIIENIQRADLNPLELAKAYKNLMEMHDYRQEDVAVIIGKSRSAIANTLRLMNLPERALSALEKDIISEGHARALLSLDSEEDILAMLAEIIKKNLSVRDTEQRVKNFKRPVDSGKSASDEERDLFIKTLADEFEDFFKSKVAIRPKKRGGVIEIAYSSSDNLEAIIKIIRGEQ